MIFPRPVRMVFRPWPAWLAALALAALAAPALAQDAQFRTTTLSLSATGEVRATPDMVTITLGAENRAPVPGDAMRANSATMNKVIAALKTAGAAEKDIQTSGLSLNAQYSLGGIGQPQVMNGYLASNTITVITRDTARAGPLIDAALAAGASIVRGVSFGLQDPNPSQDTARLDAVKDLTARADLYAKATGLRVMRMVSMNDGGGFAPSPLGGAGARATLAPLDGQRTAVEAGQLSVRVTINAVYELGH